MEEKRRNKRLDIDVNIQLERLDKNEVTTLKYAHVKVLDVSKTGIGFLSPIKLDMEATYETKIQIWTKEVLDCFIKIVRETPGAEDGEYNYGAIFVGMTETDSLKIDIYRIFNEM